MRRWGYFLGDCGVFLGGGGVFLRRWRGIFEEVGVFFRRWRGIFQEVVLHRAYMYQIDLTSHQYIDCSPYSPIPWHNT